MSALKNGFPLLPSPLTTDTYASSIPTNNQQQQQPVPYSSYRKNSRSFVDLNQLEHHSGSPAMYRSSSPFSPARPSLFHQTREKERFELSTLNDKFADYVEKVRYLEAQNKKIQMDSSLLTEKQQEGCQRMKSIFETEMKQVKEVIERIFKDKASMVITVKDAQVGELLISLSLCHRSPSSLQNAIPVLKQQLNQTFKDCDSSKYETEKTERQLAAIEGDLLMFQRRLTHQDNEHSQWKQFITHLQRLVLQGKNEINGEIISHGSCEQAAKQLRLDMNKLREHNQQKLKELQQTSLMLGSSSSNDRAHMFKSELSSAIRKVRQEFERQNESHRQELYTQFTHTYEDIARQHPDVGHLFLSDNEQERIRHEQDRVRVDIQRVRADTNLLKQKNSEMKLRIREYQINLEMSAEDDTRLEQLQENEINQMKSRHEKITKDYDDVVSKQISLEKEIDTYRNLLEGTMKPVVDTITEGYNTNAVNQVKSKASLRMSRSTSVDRSAPAPFLAKKTDTNFYSSLINSNNKYESNPATSTEIPITIRSEISRSKSNEDLSPPATPAKEAEPQTTGEKTEPSNNSPPPANARPPIILQTRRNN